MKIAMIGQKRISSREGGVEIVIIEKCGWEFKYENKKISEL